MPLQTMPERPITSISGAQVFDPAKTVLIAGSEAGTLQPGGDAMPVARGMTDTIGMMGYPPTVKVTSYSVAASTATSFDEATACLAAAGIMRDLALPLLSVLADEKRENSEPLRKQLHLDAIEARVAQVLAAGELQRRTDAKQDQKWVIDKWVLIGLAAGGWLVALIVALTVALLR